jgi:vacuolar-type H+-ATPase catalytic subunit A/Vma1
MLSAILSFYEKASVTLDGGKTVESIISSPVVGGIAKMKYTPEKEFQKMFEGIVRNLEVL